MNAEAHVRRVAVVGSLLLGCAFGGETGDDSGNGDAWVPGNGTSEADTDEESDDADTAVADGGDDAPTGCSDACATPPGDCWIATSGVCKGGECVFEPMVAGDPCVGDCSGSGFCDATGTCICSGSDDGTGDCESTCIAGANATATCDESGTCVYGCVAPFEDCDGDPSNGCEVPVGVAHQCDANGLNPNGGCWTAYCGDSPSAAGRFGTYFCSDCSTCEELAGGQCHWCNHTTGNFYPAEGCACGAQYLDAVCG